MRRFLLILVGLCSSIPAAMAQEASPGAPRQLASRHWRKPWRRMRLQSVNKARPLPNCAKQPARSRKSSKDLAKAVDKNADAISDQSKTLSDLREAIQDMSGTNKQVISDLREAVVALTAQTQRASADLVQAISKLAEAQRSSSDELREDVKWLRSEVRKIEPARRTVFVSYPSTVECGAGTNDCSTRATTLCTGLGFKTGSAAAYQTAPGDAKNPAKPAKFGSIGAVCSD